MRLAKGEKQAIIDDYLNKTGRNTLVVRDFLAWLEPQTEHPAWEHMFRGSLEEQALEARIARCRQFVSGLRTIVVRHVPSVTPCSVPSFVSVGAKRSEYVALDVEDEVMRRKELSQGLGTLKAWDGRYSGIAELHGCPVGDELAALIARLEAAL